MFIHTKKERKIKREREKRIENSPFLLWTDCLAILKVQLAHSLRYKYISRRKKTNHNEIDSEGDG